MIGVDDNVYQDGEAPDLGSITPVSNEKGVREYRLLSADISKLNSVVTYCGNGSTAYVVDTGALYMFHSGTWYEQ